MKGKLIAICGIDGSGKSTLLKNLEKYYDIKLNSAYIKMFYNPIFTNELEEVAHKFNIKRRECFSNSLRSVIWMDDLIYNYYRYIEPELEKEKIVFVDRYTICNEVYTICMAKGYINQMFKIYNTLKKPDLLIYLDVNEEIAVDRIKKRKIVAPYENRETLKELKKLYEEKIKEADYSIYKINADLSETRVLENVVNVIDGFLQGIKIK